MLNSTELEVISCQACKELFMSILADSVILVRQRMTHGCWFSGHINYKALGYFYLLTQEPARTVASGL